MRERGFINIIILIALALVILGYFNIDIRKVADLPIVKMNLHFGWELAKKAFAELMVILAPYINGRI
jgi:hypothetical protein